MKTIALSLAAALLALSAASCSGSSEKKGKAASEGKNTVENVENADPVGQVEAIVFPETEGVCVLEDDNLLRPDKSVPVLTVIDCNAVWCGPCKKLDEPLKKIAEKYAGSVVVFSVDFEKLPETAKAYNVTSVPVVFLQKPDGTLVRYDGIGDFLTDTSLPKDEAAAQIFDNLCKVVDQNL